jgi:ubiquitin-activating enzyme E1 C
VQFIDAMLAHPTLGPKLAHPSVAHERNNLYARGIWEEETRPNLAKPLRELLGGETAALLMVNDKKLQAPLRVRAQLGEAAQ